MSEDNINVKVGYILDVNHEPLADCQIRINVKSKDAGDFQITKNYGLLKKNEKGKC